MLIKKITDLEKKLIKAKKSLYDYLDSLEKEKGKGNISPEFCKLQNNVLRKEEVVSLIDQLTRVHIKLIEMEVNPTYIYKEDSNQKEVKIWNLDLL